MVRGNNEDQLLVGTTHFAVADGMGGHVAGEVASLTAVEAVRRGFEEDQSATGLVLATLRANRAVWERGQQDPKLRGMGTTLCTLALVTEDDEERIAIVNVGDSRAYRLHDGELEQLTEDHSLINELVREGQLSEDEAAYHPQRHILSRALGVDPDVEVDCIQLLPLVGDRYVLCSDGLTGEVSDGQIASTLRRIADPKDAVKELIARAKANGGKDNITVVVVDVVDDDERSEEASVALASAPAPVRTAEPADTVEPAGDSPVDDKVEKGRVDTASAAEPPPEAPASAAAKRAARTPILTLRTVVFVVLLVGILAVAALAVGLYARGAYFVGVGPNQRITVYKGRPGGVLWFKPTIDHVTTAALSDLQAQAQEEVKANKQESSRAAADAYVARNLAPTTTTTASLPPATSTTTVP
jgi:protein phosphatase